MKMKLTAAITIVLTLGMPGFAHRLDEYLQATILSIETNRVQFSMRLIPGVAVSSGVIASMDTNADGVISESEQRAYVEQVLRDLSLNVDGHPLEPRLVSASFPKIDQMKRGLGEIQIEFIADLPPGGANRKLVFEHRHPSPIAAYLVNCLIPRDRDIHVVNQSRNRNQSFYAVEYTQSVGRLGTAGAMPGALSGFGSVFRLGMRHIAEGTDHLLFRLVLLLPVSLFVIGSRWAGFAGLWHSVVQILKVVTAFTVGHSITLALAGLGVIRIPSRPIEILIAVSILVSSIHALRPLFPGREAALAGFFGLVHGLAFAATLDQLGLDRWVRIVNILAFNLGIETMQMVVVVAVMPSLVLLSRTRAYSSVRIGGALFAAIASIGWIAQRLLHFPGPVDIITDSIAGRGVWIAAFLFLISVFCWRVPNSRLLPR